MDDSLISHTATHLHNNYSNITVASQVFAATAPGYLKSIEIYAENVYSHSLGGPGGNTCYIRLFEHESSAAIGASDSVWGYSCEGHPAAFSFETPHPFLQSGVLYRWDFVWGGQNRNSISFLGSATNTVGGLFSFSPWMPPHLIPPVINAKFAAYAFASPFIVSLEQREANGITAIAEGDILIEPAVTLRALGKGNADQPFRLEIELRKSGEAFTGAPTNVSGFGPSGEPIDIHISGIEDGGYFWQARIVDERGNSSDWRQFGAPETPDFEIYTARMLALQSAATDSSVGSWYGNNWYWLGRGIPLTINSFTIRGYASDPVWVQVFFDEFSDARYSNLARTFIISENAPFTGESADITFAGLDIPLREDRFYRLRTAHMAQNRVVILSGISALSVAMYDNWVFARGKVEYLYPFYPYIVINAVE